MRTPVEPGVTVDDVPSRRGAPPPPSRVSTPQQNQTIRAAALETTRSASGLTSGSTSDPTSKDRDNTYEIKNSGVDQT